MQRWLTVVAVVAGVAVVAILPAVRSRPHGHGGVVLEASRLALHRESEPWHRGGAAAPAPRLLPGADLDARLRALRGRPVVLNAWASWCPPCREELPFFALAATRFGHRLAFLGADVEDTDGAARALLAEIPLGYPSYATSLDNLRSLSPALGVPFTLFIDSKGSVANARIGAYRSEDELDADLGALLRSP